MAYLCVFLGSLLLVFADAGFFFLRASLTYTGTRIGHYAGNILLKILLITVEFSATFWYCPANRLVSFSSHP